MWAAETSNLDQSELRESAADSCAHTSKTLETLFRSLWVGYLSFKFDIYLFQCLYKK